MLPVTTVAGALEAFEQHRPRLFGIAYRMLGSVADAEDVLQDAWLRWEGTDRARVADPGAYLARTVTNLCLNALTSARARREVYVGPWLPEPVVTADGALGPMEEAVQRECVSFALLAVLERLSPAERAAYVLREAFAYSPREVAELIGVSEANARQLHSRARAHVAAEQTREVEAARWQELVSRFLAAARDGDVAGLEALLADDVVARSDGGGVVNAARVPVLGREKVARYLAGVFAKFTQGLAGGFAEVNGSPAIVAFRGDELQSVLVVSTDGDRITRLDFVLNPAKLAFAGGQLSRIGGLPGRRG
jgi:RNA polymerase sigma-70 factor (TIGR02957 family)